MMTVTCKEFRVRGEADGRVTLEIEEPAPADLLPRLIKKKAAVKRLAVSPRHFDSLVAKAGIRPVDGLPIRYRENDLLKLTLPAPERLPVLRNVVAMPTTTRPLPRQKTNQRSEGRDQKSEDGQRTEDRRPKARGE
ncbi:MAG: hypothetical protein NTY01_03525 [Verrucomicrobia bacterium]|nr:hypothetical protein [Verrucomicrobiota bacterium]